jgi:hypothetical protein
MPATTMHNLGGDGGQKRERAFLAIPSRLVLNVVNYQAVRREKTQSVYLFGCNFTQPL